MWDTGAEISAISQPVISRLGLKPFGTADVRGYKKDFASELYTIDLALADGQVLYRSLPVVRCNPLGSAVIIGMDIISTGRLSLERSGDNMQFEFSIETGRACGDDYQPARLEANTAAPIPGPA